MATCCLVVFAVVVVFVAGGCGGAAVSLSVVNSLSHNLKYNNEIPIEFWDQDEPIHNEFVGLDYDQTGRPATATPQPPCADVAASATESPPTETTPLLVATTFDNVVPCDGEEVPTPTFTTTENPCPLKQLKAKKKPTPATASAEADVTTEVYDEVDDKPPPEDHASVGTAEKQAGEDGDYDQIQEVEKIIEVAKTFLERLRTKQNTTSDDLNPLPIPLARTWPNADAKVPSDDLAAASAPLPTTSMPLAAPIPARILDTVLEQLMSLSGTLQRDSRSLPPPCSAVESDKRPTAECLAAAKNGKCSQSRITKLVFCRRTCLCGTPEFSGFRRLGRASSSFIKSL